MEPFVEINRFDLESLFSSIIISYFVFYESLWLREFCEYPG